MEIIAPVTDYIRGSLLVAQGDLVKYGFTKIDRFPIGNAGQIMRVDFLEGDIYWQDPGYHMFESEDVSSNEYLVTIYDEPISILSLEIGSVTKYERYFISFHTYFQKDAVNAGQVRISLRKFAGDAEFLIYANLTELFSYTNLLANQYGTCHGIIILQITNTGFLSVELSGLCDIGSAVVDIANAQLYGTKFFTIS